MRILAIDIGAGTQDILLFDSSKNIENSVSLVLPTPSRILANRLRALESNIFVRGDTIGGGSLTQAILQHLGKGHRVVMEEPAAYSIRNDLDEVKSMGIEIGDRPSTGAFTDFEIREIDLPLLENFLENFGENLDVDVIAIAVQDHGVAPKEISDRAFRFEKTEAMLRRDNRPESFHFTEGSIPGYYLRMRSAVAAVRRDSRSPVLVMDTAFSAILGCLDEVAGPSLIVNVGNGHTIAALVVDQRVEGIYEHHTHELTSKRLENDLRRFVRGELGSQEVFEANGHGAVTLKPWEGEMAVTVTGPHREIFKGTSFKFVYAAPGGNTMMTGPVGLVKASLFKFWKMKSSAEGKDDTEPR
jgi:uncharacterized protein (DUF1786 family)